MLNLRKRFFEKMAYKWDEINSHSEEKIHYILDSINLDKGSKILDIGTGTGILLPYILDKCNHECQITAVDYSENMIIRAKEKFPHKNISFLVQDVYSMPNSFSNYDACICYSVFPHFDNKHKIINILSNCIKKGGKLVIAHSQSRNEINDVHRKKSFAVKYDHVPMMDTIKEHFKECGLNPIKIVDNNEMFFIIGEKL